MMVILISWPGYFLVLKSNHCLLSSFPNAEPLKCYLSLQKIPYRIGLKIFTSCQRKIRTENWIKCQTSGKWTAFSNLKINYKKEQFSYGDTEALSVKKNDEKEPEKERKRSYVSDLYLICIWCKFFILVKEKYQDYKKINGEMKNHLWNKIQIKASLDYRFTTTSKNSNSNHSWKVT